MAFINYSDRQDMQDDTFKIVAILISMAITAKQNSLTRKDPSDAKVFHSLVESLHDLAGGRLKDDEEIGKEIDRIGDIIYSANKQLEPRVLSKCIDDTRQVFKRITRGLDRAGLLFRIEEKATEMFQRGSNT